MMSPTGLRSPSNPRSSASSPRPSFDSDLLRAYMKKLLQSTLQTATWPPARERDRVKAWMKEIGERVKERMIGTFIISRAPNMYSAAPIVCHSRL